jgi:putative hemolysin
VNEAANALAGLILGLGALAALAAMRSAQVNTRLSMLEQLKEEGDARAERALALATHAPRLLLSLRATQAFFRLMAIGSGLLLLLPPLNRAGLATLVGGILALLMTGLVVGLVEFGAESLVSQDPAKWAIRLSRASRAVMTLMAPLVLPLMRISRIVAPASSERQVLVTEEEIKDLVEAGEVGGVIEQEEKAMIYSIFQLGDTLAREVMVPRIDMLAFEAATGLIEATDGLLQTGYSRAPVYAETVDNVIGLVYVKDLLAAWRKGAPDSPIGPMVRPAYFVPEAKKADDLLAEMQARRIQMAIVVDEYGGTAGLVTIEDIVEEIVGEIRDEYDVAEELPFQKLKEGEFMFNGGIDLDDVNQIADSKLPKDTSETLGGFIYSQLGRVPSPGDTVVAGGLTLTVEEVHGRRIRKVGARRAANDNVETENDGTQRPADG